MKNTGRQAGRYYVHGMAIYATHRTSQPPDYRTYSPEVTSSRSNLPVHRSSTRRCVSSRADSLIIKENFLDVKRILSVFYKIFQIFLAMDICHFSRDIAGVIRPRPLKKFRQKGERLSPLPRKINMQRPSKYRWCTSCRTQGTRPQCRSGSAACSGKSRQPAPSWPARTPESRTTWTAGNRPCRRQ